MDKNFLESKEKVRKLEKYLGISGGVCGVIGAIVSFITTLLGITSYNTDTILAAIIFSIIGIIGGFIVNNNAKLSALILIIVSIGLLISIFYYGLIGAILLLIGAIIALIKS
jgi:hypothetical protein